MATTTVDLGRITVRRTQATSTITNSSSSPLPLALSLSTSCTIDLPSTWERSPDTDADTETNTQASDIAKACKEGTLWIAKAGSCQLDFGVVLLNAQDREREAIDELKQARICGLVADCPVWQDIGLQLRDRHCSLSSTGSDDDHDDGTIDEKDTNVLTSSSAPASYFLYHPDLSSDIHAPPSVPCAKFRGLSCKIVLSFVGDDFAQAESGRPGRQRNVARQADAPITVKSTRHRRPKRRDANRAKSFAQNHGYNLRRGPRLGSEVDVEDGIEGEETSSSGVPYTPAIEERSGRDGIVHHVDIVEEVGELLDAALRRLIGVGRRGSKGVRVARQSGMPSLVEIAPAVWNQRYLQSVTAHTKLIPSIATSIARLTNSRSLSLREKLKKMIVAKENPQQDISDEVTKKLWRLCQAGIRASPLLRGNRKEPLSQAASSQHAETPDVGLSECQQETQAMVFLHYWGEHGEYTLPPNMGLYGEFTGELQMGGLHDGMGPMDMDPDDSGSGSGSDVWQAEWLDPHDVEMSGYEHDDDLSNGYDSENYNGEMDEYEGEGFSSGEMDSEIYDGEDDGDYGGDDEEGSVGEYLYADGNGNVFLVDLGERNEGEEGEYSGSEGSVRGGSGSGSSVLGEIGDRSENEEFGSDVYGHGDVGRYLDGEYLWNNYDRIEIPNNVEIRHW